MEKESGFNKMAAENGVSTELGFIEKVDSHKLEAVYFPSKVGGKPAWLCQRNLPTLEELKCDSCSKIMKFLLQVYAPLDEDENCFHRMLYLFICPNEKCYSKNKDLCFKVFRSQLPRENDYFANEPISTEIEAERVFFMMENIREKSGTLLCYVCGYPAEKKCARCKVIAYCSKEHQVYDWKDGHKNDCEILKQRKGNVSPKQSSVIFPEFELLTEPEPSNENNEDMNETKSEAILPSATDDSNLETEGKFAEISDKQFEKFKNIIKREPEQVLRYSFEGNPLWVSNEHQPKSTDIPLCSCGAERIFEFQVLPQLLNHLEVDSLQGSIDWGTLAVYTCSKNCTSTTKYSLEFVWKQDFSDTHVEYQ